MPANFNMAPARRRCRASAPSATVVVRAGGRPVLADHRL